MQKVVKYLLYASRSLAICAVLVGVGEGLQWVLFGGLICVDSCGQRSAYFDALGPDVALHSLTLCIVCEALALATFLAYCLATRQAWRPIISILFLLVGGAAGLAALNALLQDGQSLPVGDSGFLFEAPMVAWVTHWGWTLTLVAGVWSGVPALIQWRRGATQPDS